MGLTEAALERGNGVPGTAAIVWTVGLGIVGFLLVLAVWYAMVAESHIPAVICSTLLLLPLLSTLVWEFMHARRE